MTPEIDPKAQKKLEKLAKYLKNKDISTIENLIELDEKVDNLDSKIETGLSSLKDELKKKLDEELTYDIDPEEIRGEKGDNGRNPMTISKTPPVNPEIGDLWYKN